MTKQAQPDRIDEAAVIMRNPESTSEQLAAAGGLVDAEVASIQAEIAGSPERKAEIRRSDAPMATKDTNLEAEDRRLKALDRRLTSVETLKSQLAERSEQRRREDWAAHVEALGVQAEGLRNPLAETWRARAEAIAASLRELLADATEVDEAVQRAKQPWPTALAP